MATMFYDYDDGQYYDLNQFHPARGPQTYSTLEVVSPNSNPTLDTEKILTLHYDKEVVSPIHEQQQQQQRSLPLPLPLPLPSPEQQQRQQSPDQYQPQPGQQQDIFPPLPTHSPPQHQHQTPPSGLPYDHLDYYSPHATTIYSGDHGLHGEKIPAERVPGGMDGIGKGKILGLPRRTFFILIWVTTLLIAIAVGIGAGVGVGLKSHSSDSNTSGSNNNNGNDGGLVGGVSTAAGGPGSMPDQTASPGSGSQTQLGMDASSTASSGSVKTKTRTHQKPSTTLTTSSHPSSSSSSSPPPPEETTTSNPPPTSSPTSSPTPTPTAQAGYTNGRCVNNWGGDCICLDANECATQWQGQPYRGTVDNRPCPGSSTNPDQTEGDTTGVMACVVQPCGGRGRPAQCLWADACGGDTADTSSSAPACPGGGDFVCCSHSWV